MTLALTSREQLYLWDWTSGKEPREIKCGTKRPSALAFSPDGKTLAVGSDYGHPGLRLLELPTGRGLHSFAWSEEREFVRHVSFSPNGKWLASVNSARKTVDLWDAATGKRMQTFDLSPGGAGVSGGSDGHDAVPVGLRPSAGGGPWLSGRRRSCWRTVSSS